MAPITFNVIIILAAASPIRAIFEVVFWIIPDGGIFSIKLEHAASFYPFGEKR
jgi:hypothetical protein